MFGIMNCVRCHQPIRVDQRSLPTRPRKNAPAGWRHAICDGADIVAARKAADAANTVKQKHAV